MPTERGDFRDESIYFIMTSCFYDGDSSNNCVSWRDTGTDDNNNSQNAAGDPVWRGDFKGIVEKLDYIKALGFLAIWITDTAMTVIDLGKSIGMTESSIRNEAERCKNLKSDENDPDRIFHHEKNCQWEGYTVQTGQMGAHCVDLNTENPIVTDYLKECYTNYINMGVDAF